MVISIMFFGIFNIPGFCRLDWEIMESWQLAEPLKGAAL